MMKPYLIAKHAATACLLLVALMLTAFIPASAEPSLKALIVTGQSNHAWQTAYPILKTILEDTGLFFVDVAISPEPGQDMSAFAPPFAEYHVIVLNYTGDDWPETTRQAFLDYVQNGGGVVVVHEANNAFPEWPEYNEIIGLGGWGNRSERHGPYVRWQDGNIIYDMTPGPGGAHGRQHEFVVEHRIADHPVTSGLPDAWRHGMDELYHHLRGPAKNMTVLATAWSDPETGGTGNHEPILFTVQYGKGRMFQTALGHPGENAESTPAMQCAGFIVTLQRGAEWAATGTVTQAVPDDFPTEDAVSLRPRFKLETVDSLMQELAAYKFNDPLEPLALLEAMTRKRMSMDDPVDDLESGYLQLLQRADLSREARQFAAKQLSLVGSAKSVPMLAELLLDRETSYWARFALERIPESTALTALRTALPLVGPEQRAGIIGSLAARRDGRATDLISAALHDEDERVVTAAMSALAAMDTTEAAVALLAAVDLKTGPVRAMAQDAYVQCGYSMLNARRNREARAVFDAALAAMTDNPLARAAALRGKITAAGKRGNEVILQTLKSPDADLHPIAASEIRTITDKRMLRELAECCPALAPYCQVILLTALSETEADGVTDVLMSAARSDVVEVRIAALDGLGRIGAADATLFLAERATAASGKEQQSARSALSRLRGATPVLMKALQSGNISLRAELIQALVARRVKDAVPLMISMLQTVSPEEQLVIIDGLTLLADPEQLDLIMPLLMSGGDAAAEKQVSDMAASVAKKADPGESRLVALKQSLEKETDAAARARLYETIGKIADDSALPLLAAGLEESDAGIQAAVVAALAAWPNEGPLEVLRGAAERLRGTPAGSDALRGCLRLAALNKERNPDEAAALFGALFSLAATPEEQQACIAAIGKTGADSALPFLYDILGQGETVLALETVRALGNWPNTAPMIRLELLAKDGPKPLRQEALRGYFRLIGANRELSREEAKQRYQELFQMAPNADDKRSLLNGLAGVRSPVALTMAADHLADPELKADAENVMVQIASQIISNHPDAVMGTLREAAQQTGSDALLAASEKLTAALARFEEHITAWEVAGPYGVESADAKQRFEAPFAPELPGEKDAVLWRMIDVGTNNAMPFLVELDKTLGGMNCVAYLRTYVWADADMDALLETGSDDGNRVWINGELVSSVNAVRPAARAQDKAPVRLRSGWNELLMKVTQGGGEWSACARLRTPDGAAIPGLRAAVQPE